jgi:lysophospholipase L1-like esterase
MFECLILGDSIGVGLHQFMPKCQSISKGGWNTWQWNKSYLKNDLTSEVVIISLGSNDHKHIKTQVELEKLREKVKANRVYWVLPAGNLPAGGLSIIEVQRIIKMIAAVYGDQIIPIQGLQKDGIHPTWEGYKQIAKAIK